MDPNLIHNKIHELRGLKVMLDFDLAELYCVETKQLNLSVKRNLKRFPHDFMFQLSVEEWDTLRLQFETSKRGGRRYLFASEQVTRSHPLTKTRREEPAVLCLRKILCKQSGRAER